MLDISQLPSRVGEWGTKVLISLHYMGSRIGARRGDAFPTLGYYQEARARHDFSLAWLGA